MGKIFIFLFLISILLSAVPLSQTLAVEGYRLQVSIPTGAGTNIAKGSGQSDLGGYVTTIYNFSLFAVGIIALLAFVIGAIEFTISAGFVSRRGDAQDRMIQAVFGLLLLLGAVIIFNTINPNILSRGSLGLVGPSPTQHGSSVIITLNTNR